MLKYNDMRRIPIGSKPKKLVAKPKDWQMHLTVVTLAAIVMIFYYCL